MHIDIGVMLLVLVLGCAAFFFGILYAIARLLGAVRHAILSLLWPKRRPAATSRASNGHTRLCSREQCRHAEHREAVYCSQCGALLDDAPASKKL